MENMKNRYQSKLTVKIQNYNKSGGQPSSGQLNKDRLFAIKKSNEMFCKSGSFKKNELGGIYKE